MKAALILALLALTIPYRASADPRQEWIHKNRPDCCNHLDCFPAKAKWTPKGWQVEGAPQPVPEREVIAWPFGAPYACWDGRRVRCLLMDSGQ